MKRLSKYLLVIMLSLFIIPIISVNVNAATLDVKTINASITNNKISVDGTVDNGVLAVAIMIYEEDGTTLVTMETTSVDSNDKYSDTIDVVTAGKKYIVKAANYDGGTYVTAEVDGTVNDSNNNTNNENSNNSNNNTTNTETSNKVDNTTNPKTGDNIIIFSIIFVIALTGILVTFIINKKRVKNNK